MCSSVSCNLQDISFVAACHWQIVRVAKNLFSQFLLMRKHTSFYLIPDQYSSNIWSLSQGNLSLVISKNRNFWSCL